MPSGKVAAIMGPSGAGKSSLLNVLAGRSGDWGNCVLFHWPKLSKLLWFHSSCGHYISDVSAAAGSVAITGDIFVAGRKINPVTFRENIAYVMQDDSLLATATPREALTFSANLRYFRFYHPLTISCRSEGAYLTILHYTTCFTDCQIRLLKSNWRKLLTGSYQILVSLCV